MLCSYFIITVFSHLQFFHIVSVAFHCYCRLCVGWKQTEEELLLGAYGERLAVWEPSESHSLGFASNMCPGGTSSTCPVELMATSRSSSRQTKCFRGNTQPILDFAGQKATLLTFASDSGFAGSAGTANSTVRVSTAITPTGIPPSLKEMRGDRWTPSF